MSPKTIGFIGVAVAGVAVYCAWKTKEEVNGLKSSFSKAVGDVADVTTVDISEAIIEEAVDKVVEREVKIAASRACRQAVDNITSEITSQIRAAVSDEYSNIKESVSEEIKRQVENIDITKLRNDVVKEAKEQVLEKFDDNLDSILEKFNNELESVSKIYKSIADTMTKTREGNSTVLRIS